MNKGLRLAIGIAALSVVIFLNFIYAYQGYGLSNNLFAKILAANPETDCGTDIYGHKILCNTQEEIIPGGTICDHYYTVARKKIWLLIYKPGTDIVIDRKEIERVVVFERHAANMSGWSSELPPELEDDYDRGNIVITFHNDKVPFSINQRICTPSEGNSSCAPISPPDCSELIAERYSGT